MRALVILGSLFGLAGCAGQTTAQTTLPNDASSGVADAARAHDGPESLPEAGSAQCMMQNDSGTVSCTTCDDHLWHCALETLYPCDAGAAQRASCEPYTRCYSCAEDGLGSEYLCDTGGIWTGPYEDSTCSN